MRSSIQPVRARFAPSPTGHVHLGSARTALFDYLIAQQTKGQFILRIEDTDQKRLVQGAEAELIENLHWLGIKWDEGPDVGGPFAPYRQSERKEIYLKYARELVEKGYAYYCFCSTERLNQVRKEKQAHKELPHYDGLCRQISLEDADKRIVAGEPHVIRFKTPRDGKTTVVDLIRGDVTFDNATLDDYILVKADGWALYHLAAIVDDHLMQISHVIRGSEWLPTSPLHAMIWKAFGWKEPVWVHLSVFLKPSGKGKMSKREASDLQKDGYSIYIKDLKELGYLPEAVINWIALMGWSFDDRSERFSMNDLIDKFSLEKLNPSPAAINFSKLDYFNKTYIKSLPYDDLANRIRPFFEARGFHPEKDTLIKMAPIINERITTLDESVEKCEFFFVEKIEYSLNDLIIENLSPDDTMGIAEKIVFSLENIQDWNSIELEASLGGLMKDANLTPKQLLSYIREAISGQKVTPPLFESMEILGKPKTIERLRYALEFMRSCIKSKTTN
jgi:glutamyl-tRNA synthetase